MKISKIPGLGRFGTYIDDINFDHITDEEWMEIGKIHLQSLVTIIRAPKIYYETYYTRFLQWGTPRWNRPIYSRYAFNDCKSERGFEWRKSYSFC